MRGGVQDKGELMADSIQEDTREKRQKRLFEIYRQGTIYLVTEQSLSQRSTEEVVLPALRGGVRMVQMREKNKNKRDRLALAHRLRHITQEFEALLFIDDEVDIAHICDADGVHLGLDDLPITEIRRNFPKLLVGGSTHNLAEAQQAIGDGADYINIGPIFPTDTKSWSGEFLGLDNLRQIAEHVYLPFSVMGGIKREHIPQLTEAGARICAMVTGLTQAEHVLAEATSLTELLQQNLR